MTLQETYDQLDQQYIERGYWKDMTLGEAFSNLAVQYGEKAAIIDRGRTYSYHETDTLIRKATTWLRTLGIKKGDIVLLQLTNRASFVFVDFALYRIGAIPVLLLPAQRENEILAIAKLTDPVAYIVADKHMGYDYSDLAKRVSAEQTTIHLVIMDGDCEEDSPFIPLNGFWDAETDLEPAAPAFRDVAHYLLSGGTTSIPKLIPRTHTDYLYCTGEFARRSGASSDTVYLAVVPIAHNYALGAPGIIGTFQVGGTVVMCAVPSPDEIFDLIEEHSVTLVSLVPALAALCLEYAATDGSLNFESLEVVQTGGAVLDESIARRIPSELNCTLQQQYGIAEGFLSLTDLNDDDEIIFTTQGKPAPYDLDVCVVDTNGNEMPRGEFGELRVRGPYTIRQYYKADEANRTSFDIEGRYCTGDNVCIRPDGNFVVAGRLKEQINRAGEKIVPREVETHLCAHDSIRDAIVLGVKDGLLGERICAFIIGDKKLSREAIREYLLSCGLTSFKMPDQIEYIEQWPVTSVGKPDKKALSVLAEQSYTEKR